ncbi:hypothetical protein GCM10009839_83650 [Catenulispora yoronensis]|uniref:Peptidoglycan binding-like domain-containing protein n=1 Tax=Catenulispora yoronensis TaxID=450799 RepID=A0ABN2VFX5_9ACTN
MPVRQPAPQGGARPPQHTGFSAGLAAPAGPRPGRPLPPDGAPSLPSVFGPTSDLRPEPNPGAKPARRKPEWILSADLRVSGQPPATTPSAGRDLARRPGSETAIMPADGSGDDLPPSLRAGNGGRHRGSRRPAMLRAAVPVVAVLAAGGGALGLVHATGSGTPESQALDSASRTADSAVTTNLANAPSGVDGANGDGPASGSDPASSGFDATSPGPGAHTVGGTTGVRSDAPGAPATVPGNRSVSGSATAGAPTGASTSSPVANGPLQSSAPSLPGTPESSAPVTTPPTATPPSATDPTGTPPSTPTTPTPTPPATTPTTPSDPPPSTPTPTPTGPTATTPTPTPTETGGQPAPTGRVLQTGDTGTDVANLQTELDRLGTPTWVPVTGVYDTRTADAVAYVQNKLNITDDPRGVCGPTTAAAISTLAAAQS